MDTCKIVWTLWLVAFVLSSRSLLVPKMVPRPEKAARLREKDSLVIVEANRLMVE
jgi:hypothetical protein